MLFLYVFPDNWIFETLVKRTEIKTLYFEKLDKK